MLDPSNNIPVRKPFWMDELSSLNKSQSTDRSSSSIDNPPNINQLVSEINDRTRVLWRIVMVLVFILGMLISYIAFYMPPPNKQHIDTIIPTTKYYSINVFKFNRIG